LLEQLLQLCFSIWIAAPARMPWRTLVSADENMFLELGHENNVQDAAKILRGQKVNFMGLEHGGQPAAAGA
jgi:hypothetical protein